MSDLETVEQPLNPHVSTIAGPVGTEPTAATNQAECPTCGGTGGSAVPSYVYVLGQIQARFPRLSVEKEFAQASGRSETNGLTDPQALQQVLARRENRYLARQLCWVMTIEGLEAYVLAPRDPADLELLIEALRQRPRPTDIDLVIGVKGSIAAPTFCNGLTVPIVAFDQIYSFDLDSLVREAKPDNVPSERFAPVAEEVLGRIMLMFDNHGNMPEHRALNYLAVRYPRIYTLTAEKHGHNFALSGIEVRPSPLSGVRQIVDVILAYTHRQHDVLE
jgi:hypothetical protein